MSTSGAMISQRSCHHSLKLEFGRNDMQLAYFVVLVLDPACD